MGWSTWYAFGPDINETRVLQTADALVSAGLSALGYEYLLIDDNWMAPQRDRYGNLYGDPHRFPSGMKSLADKVRLEVGVGERDRGREWGRGGGGGGGRSDAESRSITAGDWERKLELEPEPEPTETQTETETEAEAEGEKEGRHAAQRKEGHNCRRS